MNINEALETFRQKYNFKDIWKTDVDEAYGVIYVYTANAKIWVDLPGSHEGFQVKMNVARKPRPAPASA